MQFVNELLGPFFNYISNMNGWFSCYDGVLGGCYYPSDGEHAWRIKTHIDSYSRMGLMAKAVGFPDASVCPPEYSGLTFYFSATDHYFGACSPTSFSMTCP